MMRPTDPPIIEQLRPRSGPPEDHGPLWTLHRQYNGESYLFLQHPKRQLRGEEVHAYGDRIYRQFINHNRISEFWPQAKPQPDSFYTVEDPLLARIRLTPLLGRTHGDRWWQFIDEVVHPTARLLVSAKVDQYRDPQHPEDLIGTVITLTVESGECAVTWGIEEQTPVPALRLAAHRGLPEQTFTASELLCNEAYHLEITPPGPEAAPAVIELGLNAPATGRPELYAIVRTLLNQLGAVLSDHLQINDSTPYRLFQPGYRQGGSPHRF